MRTIEKNLPFCKLLRSTSDLVTCLDTKFPLRKNPVWNSLPRTCNNYKVTYCRKSLQHSFTGASEHIRISNLTGKHIKNTKDLAISD